MTQFSLEEYLKNSKRLVITRKGRLVKIVDSNRASDLYPIEFAVSPKIHYFATKEGRLYKDTYSDNDLFFLC